MSKIEAKKTGITVLMYHGSKRHNFDPKDYDVVLTTYGTLSKEWENCKPGEEEVDSCPTVKKTKGNSQGLKLRRTAFLGRTKWFRVILDEAQRIKNAETIVAVAAANLRAGRRWCLTGTPVQNSPRDLLSYLRFLHCHPYSDDTVFDSFLSHIKHNEKEGYASIRKEILVPRMLRRVKGQLTFISSSPDSSYEQSRPSTGSLLKGRTAAA